MGKIKAVLFDLDGTLLPMDQDEFIRAYFGLLAKALEPHGYESRALIKAIWSGTAEMVKNDGSETNETVYWRRFCEIFGDQAMKEQPVLEEFYKTDFEGAKDSCGFDPKAAATVRSLKASGLRTVLATNPLFPRVATRARMRWAGLTEEDFELVTTYENSSYTKPNLDYYRMILDSIGLEASECLMVGNDVGEDMIAEELGMKVFLIDRCLINKTAREISAYSHGTFDDLIKFIEQFND